ncbi:hypothetical protein [Streptomyces sp. MBT33]|uniref:hypothetical protein n=1 Tax=Streptomyces sp. MBT33 TaxID=1488363 RepID=UPI00190AAB7E|nr:hypothetical protein [Streptomyces sp. MBT33]MBK3644876.1 hypothetical protein [Streptomyces sp. MBT33]
MLAEDVGTVPCWTWTLYWQVCPPELATKQNPVPPDGTDLFMSQIDAQPRAVAWDWAQCDTRFAAGGDRFRLNSPGLSSAGLPCCPTKAAPSGGIVSDAFMPKPALKRCVVCRQLVGRKKLVFAAGGQPLHRACQSSTERSSTRSATRFELTRAPKDISRAELLKRIEALRKRDVKMKPRAAKVRPVDRLKPPTASHRDKRTVPPPQPYSGVEMRFRDGRWLQMHPDSE